MRFSLAFATIIALAACGGPSTTGHSPDFLFETSRSDVVPYKAADGTQLGLVNTSHRLVWDYQAGYSRFGSDDQLVWGPTKTFPAEELATLEAQSMDENEVAAQALINTGGGHRGGGGVGGTVCTCCYTRIDGTCGCYECVSK
ncbi:MAG: hypothetical protein U1E65_22750 [Myxococcota bacterium]